MTSGKEELKKKLMEAYEKKLDGILNEGYGKTLWDMEDEVQELKNEVGREVLEGKLSLKKMRSLPACPKCRVALGKDEVRKKQLDTTHGWVQYGRYRYECCECEKNYYPVDEELELSKKSRMSGKKEDELTRLSVRMPFEEATKTYEELRGLPASVSVAHRVVQEKGKEFAEEKIEYKPIKGEGKEHVGSDGTMVNMREEGWKEVKIGAYYKTDEGGEKEEVRYVATTASREEIGKQLYELAGRPSLEQTEQMGFIGDGSEWLDEIQQEHFVKSTRIVDFYHVVSMLEI